VLLREGRRESRPFLDKDHSTLKRPREILKVGQSSARGRKIAIFGFLLK
jgi:hypothetical protein